MSDATSSPFFYMVGDERRGPFQLEELLQQPIHRQTPIWAKGMADWTTAGNVPELVDAIPPAPPSASLPIPQRRQPNLHRFAHALFVVNSGLGLFILMALAVSSMSGGDFGPAFWIEAVGRSGLILYATSCTRLRLPWLWALGGMLPFVWLFVLLVLHNKLSRPLKADGYFISFLGRATPAKAAR